MVSSKRMDKDQARPPVKVALCLPWYDGADKDCVANMLIFQHYLGRLQERLWWLKHGYKSTDTELPPLDDVNSKAEIPKELIGTEFKFAISDEIGCSLPGMARERCVDASMRWGADYFLFYDDDMLFGNDAFLRLYLDDKPIVGALAFTGREPITPVIYECDEVWAEDQSSVKLDYRPSFEYRRDELYEVPAVGAGMMLIKREVFEKVPKPWFNSTGMGEDIFFCMMCRKHGISTYVDTRVKTIHKPTFQKQWHDEIYYDKQRRDGSYPDIQQRQSANTHAGVAGAGN